MEGENLTSGQEFLIVGFSDLPHLRVPLFIAFLLIYLLTLAGNLLIMAIIYSTSHLQTPMYFFLTHLSFLDINYTTIIFPKMLAHFFLEGTHISLTECLLQMYFFNVMASEEFLLLSVMAYDRYVAICNPLRYVIVMNKTVCNQLAAGTWIISLIDPIPHTILMSGLSFCESHKINHYFCDLTALMKLSCTSTGSIETMSYIIGAVLGPLSFVLILTSYINIIAAILKIPSTEGRYKAFSTCATHITVVILYYGAVSSTYMRSTRSMSYNKILSLSYIAVTPLCNPIIYSLKNAEFKNALRKTKKTVSTITVKNGSVF